MAELEITNLRKVFGDEDETIVAVDDLSLDIEDGEFVILVGPSGCGKSTTLRCIAGLEEPTSGDVRLAGQSLLDKRPSNRDIAMVFQNYALYPHMTAFGNMAFSLEMGTDLPRDEIRRRVEDAAELLEISELLEQRPGELSGGQQQRVALGRAIVREPEVFLLDEPLSNLDAKLRSSMRAELQELQNQLGVTTIYVTHDQTEAMTMGDRIAILNQGKLQQFGTPLECYHEPNNQFVAGFIGSPSMNFLEMAYTDGVLDNGHVQYHAPQSLLDHIPPNTSNLVVGIRPEHIETNADPGDQNVINVVIEVVEPMGDRTILYTSIGEEPIIISSAEEEIIEEGSEIPIHFPPDKMHLFDRTSGESLRAYERASPLAEVK